MNDDEHDECPDTRPIPPDETLLTGYFLGRIEHDGPPESSSFSGEEPS